MPVKIRLQRHGKKGKPFYWIVAADSRSKRDGRYLEKLGTYNPNTNPATIDLNIDHSVQWLQKGAQPTDTARAILSYSGVLLKKHLIEGVTKGALTPEQVEEKFNAWVAEKATAIDQKKNNLADHKAIAIANALEAEKAVNQARIAAAAVVVEETVAEEVAEEAVAQEVVEEAAPEAVAEEVVEEAAPEAVAEEVIEEAATEAVAEEVVEEAAPEAVAEEVVEEAATEEAPAKEEE